MSSPRALVFLVALALVACGSPLDTRDLTVADFDMSTTAPGGDGGVTCGNSECLIGADNVCCLDSAIRYCAPLGACSATPVFCDGPEDCPGAVCCQPTGTMTLVCRTQCAGTVVCHGDADCPAAQLRCCQGRLNGYGGCASAC
jgi:hypothetical protein